MKFQIHSWLVPFLIGLIIILASLWAVPQDRMAWKDAVLVQGVITSIENRKENGETWQIVRVSYSHDGQTVEGVVEGCPAGLHVGDSLEMRVHSRLPANLRAASYQKKPNWLAVFCGGVLMVVGLIYADMKGRLRRRKRSQQDERLWNLTRHVQAQVTDCSSFSFIQMQPGHMYRIACRDREGRVFEKTVTMYPGMYTDLKGRWITVCIHPSNEAQFWLDIDGQLL